MDGPKLGRLDSTGVHGWWYNPLYIQIKNRATSEVGGDLTAETAGAPWAPLENSFVVYAPTDRGFFGLTELEAFSTFSVEPYATAADPRATLVMDFSGVRIWDISALLWLVVGLDHYRRQLGLSFKLRLPASHQSMSPAHQVAAERSADYLRRWRFDRALLNIDADLSRLLVPEQRTYFDPPEPRQFYLPSKVIDETRLLQSLMSRRLTEIRNLADPSFTGSAPISPEKVSHCIREFQAARIGDILTAHCGTDRRTADLFADHILTEALLNVQEHPNATIGMLSISLMGATGELILCVADNGDSIPSTIYPRFKSDRSGENAHAGYARHQLDVIQIGEITDYATMPGVTSKTGPHAEKAGMGLTYIKADTLTVFKGRLAIVSDGARVSYGPEQTDPIFSKSLHAWRGNLLRIAIPMPKVPTQTSAASQPLTPS